MVYDLTGDGRTALKFAANRYNQPINISIIERLNPVAIGNAVTSDQRTWIDANNDPSRSSARSGRRRATCSPAPTAATRTT